MSAMSVRSAAAWALLSQYGSFAIQFAASVVLARWFIDPSELGLFSIAFAAITLVAFLQDFGITRYITGERELDATKLRSAFTLSLVVAWTIAVLAILASWPIARFYGDARLLPIALILACSYLLVPLAIVPQALCQRRMDFRSNTLIELGAALANAAISLLLAMRGYGALALAWGAFAQQAARLAISQWRAGGLVPWPWQLLGSGPILALGGTNSLLAVCGSIAARAPELLIGRIFGATAVGLFTRASGLAFQLRLLVVGAVSGVFYPAFRKVRDEGRPLGPPYLRVVAAFTGISWPALAGIAVLAEPLIGLLYGPRWLDAAPLLSLIALSQLCFVAVPLNADLPILLGRLKPLIRLNLIDTGVSVLLLVLAAPFGLWWVAASRLLYGLFWAVLYLRFLKSLLGLRFRDLAAIYGRSLVATLASIAPVLAGYGVWEGPRNAGLLQLASSVTAGILCWLAALALTRHALFGEIGVLLRYACDKFATRSAAKSHR